MAKSVRVPVKVKDKDFSEKSDEEKVTEEPRNDEAKMLASEEEAVTEANAAAEEVDELTATQQELEQYKDKYLRSMADIENLRKAWERRSEERVNEERKRLLREMLPLGDNFERAITYAQDNDTVKSGLELSYQEFLRILAREGVEPIEAEGEDFDPNLHDAVAIVPASDVEPGTVIEQIERGFLYKGELLRPSRVMVSQE